MRKIIIEDPKEKVLIEELNKRTDIKAERIKNKVYLDFDPDRRSGFTLVIAAHFLRGMRKDGFDPLAAQGRRLRVRGWITREEGATIHLSDEHQMELLE